MSSPARLDGEKAASYRRFFGQANPGRAADTLIEKYNSTVAKWLKLNRKDAVMFVGASGVGKSTVSAFVTNRATFTYNSKTQKLEAQGHAGDLAVEPIPNTSLHLFDAGTEAQYSEEDGFEQELLGSMRRRAVFRNAVTWRLVLVLRAVRCSIENDRGKHAIMDFNYMAEMFADAPDKLDSIGFIVTSPAASLNIEKGVDGQTAYATIREIENALTELTELTELGASDEVATAPGHALMKLCCQHFSNALEFIHLKEFINDGQAAFSLADEELLVALVDKGFPIFPVNVLKNQQEILQRWLESLPAIPERSLNCRPPKLCQFRLHAFLQDQVLSIIDTINSQASPWTDGHRSELENELSDLVSLLQVLDEAILPGAGSEHLGKLSDFLYKQKQCFLQDAEDAVLTGCAFKFKKALPQLRVVAGLLHRHFRKSSAGLKDTLKTCIEQRFAELFPPPEGIGGVSWSASMTKQFCKLLEITRELEAQEYRMDLDLEIRREGGYQPLNLLKTWAGSINSVATSLTEDVASGTVPPQKAIQSTMKLKELQENLSSVAEIFSKSACPLDLAAMLARAKERLEQQIASLSKQAVSRGAGDADADWKQLRQLCSSPDLKELLGRSDLVDVFVRPFNESLSRKDLTVESQDVQTLQGSGDESGRIQDKLEETVQNAAPDPEFQWFFPLCRVEALEGRLVLEVHEEGLAEVCDEAVLVTHKEYWATLEVIHLPSDSLPPGRLMSCVVQVTEDPGRVLEDEACLIFPARGADSAWCCREDGQWKKLSKDRATFLHGHAVLKLNHFSWYCASATNSEAAPALEASEGESSPKKRKRVYVETTTDVTQMRWWERYVGGAEMAIRMCLKGMRDRPKGICMLGVAGSAGNWITFKEFVELQNDFYKQYSAGCTPFFDSTGAKPEVEWQSLQWNRIPLERLEHALQDETVPLVVVSCPEDQYEMAEALFWKVKDQRARSDMYWSVKRRTDGFWEVAPKFDLKLTIRHCINMVRGASRIA